MEQIEKLHIDYMKLFDENKNLMYKIAELEVRLEIEEQKTKDLLDFINKHTSNARND